MFSKKFQRKYALTDQGIRNTKKGTFWTVIVNLVVMGGMGILYLLMLDFMNSLTDGAPLPGAALLIGLVVLFIILSLITHLQQYRATYGLVYNEVKTTRLSLAERLRKLPLGYFGKRDLADLTETLMGDVNRMEHVWSHVLGYLYGSYISTALIAICLLVYDWRLAIACLWGVPVAFGLLFGSRKITSRSAERTKKAAVIVSDGIQEALENVREIRHQPRETVFRGAGSENRRARKNYDPRRTGDRYFCQCRQRDYAFGCGNYHSCRRRTDSFRPDRLYAVVFVPVGHHPCVCAF